MDYRKMNRKAIVLDFDGTVCHLFQDFDLESVKVDLIQIMQKYSIVVEKLDDFFDVYKVILNQIEDSNQKIKILSDIEKRIVSAECEAVSTATDIEGVFEFIDFCNSQSINIGIATNNSKECIDKYLASRNIEIDIPIVGRDIHHLDHMKPSPWSLNKVMEVMGVNRENVFFIGDHPNDYKCALLAEVAFVGLITTAKKRNRFERNHCPVTLKRNYCEIVQYLGLKT